MAEFNRRHTDDNGERLVRVETDLEHVRGSLDGFAERFQVHISDTSRGFEELRGHMQTLAISSEVQANNSKVQSDAMTNLADAVTALSKSESRVTSLEEFRARTDRHLSVCDHDRSGQREKLNKTTERVDRLYWIAPILLVIVQGLWALAVHFKVF